MKSVQARRKHVTDKAGVCVVLSQLEDLHQTNICVCESLLSSIPVSGLMRRMCVSTS